MRNSYMRKFLEKKFLTRRKEKFLEKKILTRREEKFLEEEIPEGEIPIGGNSWRRNS